MNFVLQIGHAKIVVICAGYQWEPCSAAGFNSSDGAVRAGVDADGMHIYVGRAFYANDLLPAKVVLDRNTAYVSHGGQEHEVTEFELLRYGNFAWEFASHGSVPVGAVETGRTTDGEPLYTGRCVHEGTQTPGKVQPSHGCLYIPFGGVEHKIYEYEVLVQK